MLFFKGKYFGADYNIPFTLPEGSTIIPTQLGQLILTGYKPELEVTNDNITVTPNVGELVINSIAPTVVITKNIKPNKGEVILTGYEPVIDIYNPNVELEPSFGILILTGYAPSISTIQEIIKIDGGKRKRTYTKKTSPNKIKIPEKSNKITVVCVIHNKEFRQEKTKKKVGLELENIFLEENKLVVQKV